MLNRFSSKWNYLPVFLIFREGGGGFKDWTCNWYILTFGRKRRRERKKLVIVVLLINKCVRALCVREGKWRGLTTGKVFFSFFFKVLIKTARVGGAAGAWERGIGEEEPREPSRAGHMRRRARRLVCFFLSPIFSWRAPLNPSSNLTNARLSGPPRRTHTQKIPSIAPTFLPTTES